jgi:hypothetical protein
MCLQVVAGVMLTLLLLGPHPYQAGIPAEYQAVDRWFLLDTNLAPARPWSLTPALPVSSLALVQGTAPSGTGWSTPIHRWATASP